MVGDEQSFRVKLARQHIQFDVRISHVPGIHTPLLARKPAVEAHVLRHGPRPQIACYLPEPVGGRNLL